MGLQKGTTNNLNGRPKGSQNRSTEELRNTVQAFIESNIEGMQANFDQLEAKDKLLFIEKMLNYSLPRMQATQITGKDLMPIIKGITFDPEN
ncbi:MAG TPA: hypothetical protein DCR40_00890 [Prolixibacteraceae bacterium]|nr:hypothetical protein [Prolixibacteraceae bacterium]